MSRYQLTKAHIYSGISDKSLSINEGSIFIFILKTLKKSLSINDNLDLL